jgi:GNAT superfamily N-acetyltransferase
VGLDGVTSSPEEWEELISNPDVICLVAERRGEVSALAVLRRSSDEDADPGRVALLDRLYTEPASWRRGLAKSLLAKAMPELAERGFHEITLWTAEWNTSRGFYEANGWSQDGATREQSFAGATFMEVRYRTAVRPDQPVAETSGEAPSPSTIS